MRFSATVALAGIATFAWGSAAAAQTLQRLTVTSFVLSSDPAKPTAGVPFRLMVALHVRERVSSIEELELPSLASLEVLGDERRLASDASGTAYRETISLVAQRPGTVHVGPATLDAIDARDGKPKRYSTNDLTLEIAPAAGSAASATGPSTLDDLNAAIGRTALWVFLLVVPTLSALALTIYLLTSRRVSPPPAPLAVAGDPAPARTPADDFQDARAAFTRSPERATAARVRWAARRLAGAAETDTLADLTNRTNASRPALANVLAAAERATFTYDDDLPAARTALAAALEGYG